MELVNSEDVNEFLNASIERATRINKIEDQEARNIAIEMDGRRNEDTGKLQKADMIYAFADKMCGGEVGNFWIPTELKFCPFVILMRGKKEVCELKEGEVLKEQSIDWLISTIHYAKKSLMKEGSRNELYLFSFTDEADYQKISKQIMNMHPYITEEAIEPARFKSDPGYCWARIPFDPEPGPTPHFDKILEQIKTENMRNSLKWFIGELFNDGELAQNILWIHGEGGVGKGSLINTIASAFGDAWQSISVDKQSTSDRYWSSSFKNARVAFGDDVNDKYILEKEVVKQISGGMKAPVREMNKNPYSKFFKCHFVFTSNKKPHFTAEDYQSRRLVYVEFGPRLGPLDTKFAGRLKKEASAIISHCIDYWKENELPEQDGFEELRQESLESYYDVLDAMDNGKPRFTFSEGLLAESEAVYRVIAQHHRGFNDLVKRDYKRILEKDYNVKQIRKKCPKRRRQIRHFEGMCITVGHKPVEIGL
jgi:hypothetical protein